MLSSKLVPEKQVQLRIVLALAKEITDKVEQNLMTNSSMATCLALSMHQSEHPATILEMSNVVKQILDQQETLFQ